jgi:uncharacterized protein
MRFPLFLVAVLAFLAAADGASAQSTPDPAAVKEAQSLMSRFGVDALAKQQVAQMSQRLDEMFQSIDLGKDKDELLSELAQRIQKQMESRLPRYFEDATVIYARVFTFDELKELNAFYDSPLGRKLVQKMPELLRECNELSQRMGVEVFREVWQSMLPEFEKRGVKPPSR